MPVSFGERRIFVYQCWESLASGDAELWRRTVRPVVVLRRLKNVDESEVGRMFRVRFDDGFEGEVFEYELSRKTDVILPADQVRRTNPPHLEPWNNMAKIIRDYMK